MLLFCMPYTVIAYLHSTWTLSLCFADSAEYPALGAPAPVQTKVSDTPSPATKQATAYTQAQCLFMGIEAPEDVPDDVRNCWADCSPTQISAAGGYSPEATSPAMALPHQPTPDKLCFELGRELGQVGHDRLAPFDTNDLHLRNQAIMPEAAQQSNSVSGPRSSGNEPEAGIECQLDCIVRRGSSRRADSSICAPLQPAGEPSGHSAESAQTGGEWDMHSMFSGGAILGAAEDDRPDEAGTRGPSSHMSDFSSAEAPPWMQRTGMRKQVLVKQVICVSANCNKVAESTQSSPAHCLHARTITGRGDGQLCDA